MMMADGKRRDEYNRWAPLLVMTANANRDPKKSSELRIEDFHPYMKREESEVMKVSLRQALGGGFEKAKRIK